MFTFIPALFMHLERQFITGFPCFDEMRIAVRVGVRPDQLDGGQMPVTPKKQLVYVFSGNFDAVAALDGSDDKHVSR